MPLYDYCKGRVFWIRRQFCYLFVAVPLSQDGSRIDIVPLLQKQEFFVVGSEDGLEPRQLIEQLWVLIQIVDPVSIENSHTAAWQPVDQSWKESVHITASPQSRPNYPGVDGPFPSPDLGTPILQHPFFLLQSKLDLFIGDKDGMSDDLRGVGLDGSRTKLGAEYVAEVTSHPQRSDGRIVGSSSELIRTSDNSDSSVLSSPSTLFERGEHPGQFFEEFVIESGYRHLSHNYTFIIITESTMNESHDCRNNCLQLRTEIEILKAQKEEAEEREANLRRQMEIMSHAQEESQVGEGWEHEVDRLRQEVVSLLGEKEQLENLNRTYLQKIDDLKYHNGQLKTLNQKMTQLHNREIDMMRRESLTPELVRELEDRQKILLKEKEVLSRQLQQVAKVAAEMEQYYVGEFRKKNEQLREREDELFRLSRDLQGIKTQRYHNQDIIKQVNQHWEQQTSVLRDRYEREISELRNKIKFLINKIENEEEKQSKPSLGALSAISDMIQSKMVQSSSSVDSFRVGTTAQSKDHLTRRNTSGAKTPNKYSNRTLQGETKC